MSEEDPISVADLDEFARRQWEGVLGYMVGSTGLNIASEGVTLSEGVKMLLASGRLVEARGKTVAITKDGFAFILQEVNAQVWTMLILYLQNAESVGFDISFGTTFSSRNRAEKSPLAEHG